MNIQECTEAIRAKVGDNSGLNAVWRLFYRTVHTR